MRTGRKIFGLALAMALAACGHTPSQTQLEADNPLVAAAPPPFGMEEFFAVSHQPSPARVRLGRWLFYDTRLSRDGSVSCATCHRPDFAFSEPLPVPTGIGGQRGRRKTPSLINLAVKTALPDGLADPGQTFFWDGRAGTLEAQALAPIANPEEMGLPHVEMLARLSRLQGYQRYFTEAFGTAAITTERVASALADFVRTRRSGNAPYDRWSYQDSKAMSPEAQRGSEIFFFKGNCASCHAGFNFSDGRFHNLGVGWDEKTQTFADVGRMAITHEPRDRGAFKTPGLREVDKRAPYMHDGSLATLRDVVDFYDRGGIQNPRHSARIRPLGLTDDEKNALIAFLRALSGEGYQDRPPRYFPQ